MIALLGLAPAAAALKWSGPVTAIATAATAVVLLVAAQLAFQAGWIIALVAPSATLTVAAFGVAALAGTQRIARRLPARWR